MYEKFNSKPICSTACGKFMNQYLPDSDSAAILGGRKVIKHTLACLLIRI